MAAGMIRSKLAPVSVLTKSQQAGPVDEHDANEKSVPSRKAVTFPAGANARLILCAELSVVYDYKASNGSVRHRESNNHIVNDADIAVVLRPQLLYHGAAEGPVSRLWGSGGGLRKKRASSIRIRCCIVPASTAAISSSNGHS